MGELAEKLSVVPQTNASQPQTIVELAHYLNNAATERPPTLIWSKEPFDDSQGGAVGEAAQDDMYSNLPALEEAQRAPRKVSLALVSLIGLMFVAAGALYHLSTTPSDTKPRQESAATEATFTRSPIAAEEAVPVTNEKASIADVAPSKADDRNWTNTLTQYERLSRTWQDKAKQPANEQLLERLEAWMNKGAR